MAFKLTKAEQDRLDTYIEKLNDRRERLSDLLDGLNTVIEQYNEYLGEVRGFCEDIANERQGEWDDKSERWQEGDKGSAAQDWVREWEQVALNDFDAYEMPEEDHGDNLQQLPAELNE